MFLINIPLYDDAAESFLKIQAIEAATLSIHSSQPESGLIGDRSCIIEGILLGDGKESKIDWLNALYLFPCYLCSCMIGPKI